jgi:transposase
VSDNLIISSDKDARIASLEALLAEAKAELLHRDLLIETMRVQLARLRRMQFGASSEKLSQEIEQLELALEELEAATVEV